MSEINSTKSITKQNKTNNYDNDSIANNQKSAKMEILQFKDEVLKDIKHLKREIAEKYELNTSLFTEKLTSYDTKISSLNERIIELSLKVDNDSNSNKKIDMKSFIDLKNQTRDNILTLDIKMNNIDKQLKDNIYRIDNILTDTVIYPAIIGKSCKFKTFHQLLDYLLTHASQCLTFREKNSLDLNSYKKKMESLIQNFQNQKDIILDQTSKQISKKAEETEENLKSLITLYDDRLKETRAQNAEYMKSMEDSLNEVRKQLDEFDVLKNQIFEKIKEEGNLVKEENLKTQNVFLGYKKEFNILKEKFTQLSEFIKDVRFRINIGEEPKRREFFHMSNNIDFSKVPKSDKNNNKMNNTNYIINEFPEINKKDLKPRRGSAQFREKTKKKSLISKKGKSKNSIKSNIIRKARHNTIDMGRSIKNSQIPSSQNDNKIDEKMENKNIMPSIDPFSIEKNLLEFTDDNEFDNKSKNNDIINLRKNSKNKKESISTNNNEKRRSTIHVGSLLMRNIKKYELLNKSNSSSPKSSSVESHEKNINDGNVVIIKEYENPQKLIEDKKNSEIIEKNNQNLNLIKNFNSMNDKNQKKIINNSRNNSQIIINEKSNHKSNNNSQILKNDIVNDTNAKNNIDKNISSKSNKKRSQASTIKTNIIKEIENTKEKEEKFKKESTKEMPSSLPQEDNGFITIKNFSLQSQPKLVKTFNQISKTNSNNLAPTPKKNINRTQSALNKNISNNIPNDITFMGNNYGIQKEKILRPSSSATNIYLGRNPNNKKIIINSINKNPYLEYKTFYQKNTLEENNKFYNQKLNNKSHDTKKINNNPNSSKEYDIFNDYNNYKFKSHKIRNVLSPNVQVMQYGVQQLYNNNYGKNNIKLYQNKNYLNKGNNKKLFHNTENNFNKYKNISDRNNEAKEIQGMINNLQSYIRGYEKNYINGDELREERKKIKKNSSYYKFKEIVNGNDYETRKNINSKSTKNKNNFGDFGFNI